MKVNSVANMVKMGQEAPKREKYQKQLDELMQMALSGDLQPIEIRDISEQLILARRKYTTSQRDPETTKLAAQKGVQTKKAQAEVDKLRIEVLKKYRVVFDNMWDSIFRHRAMMYPKFREADEYWMQEIFPKLKEKYPSVDKIHLGLL